MVYSRDAYISLPEQAGVYVFLNSKNTVLYVGKAKNLKSRVSSYFTNSDMLGPKTKVLVEQIDKIKITIVESELEALLLEAFYIKKFNPKYNIRLTDNKSYVRIRITIKDSYPKVLLARREENKNSIYFGPYPNSGAVKLVLKTIRKIFPYQSVWNHPKRICLYNHLGLCPCPPVNDSPYLKGKYKKNIKGIIRILEGESKKVMRDMERLRDEYSQKERYEDAQEVQKKIEALSIITTPFHRPIEYDVNPNLREDIRTQELQELMHVLNNQIPPAPFNKGGVPQDGGFISKLERIECYDISNIQGTNATGSMVVFVHGEKESSQYRRFKIHKDGKPNDFAMMKEMLKRRFQHDEWDMPDLIIVDGGKGQVSSAVEAIASKGLTLPLIGLAKREETIVIPGESNFGEVSLPKNSQALHLIMRIRDEAHRFAITYHKKLRSNAALE